MPLAERTRGAGASLAACVKEEVEAVDIVEVRSVLSAASDVDDDELALL